MSRNDTNFRGESCCTQTVKMHVKDEPLTPPEGIDNGWDSCSSGIKKSLSMSDLLTDSMYHIRANGSVSELLGVKNEFESMAASESHFQNDRPGRSRNDTNFRGESCYTQTVKMHVKDEPLTPPEGIDNRWDSCSFGIKKSLSMSDLLTDSMYHIRANGSVSELLDVKNEFESMAASESHFQNDRPGCSRNDTNFRGESCYTQTVKMRVKDEPLTPPEGIDNGWDSCCSGIKKSLSMSDLLTDSMYHIRANGSVSELLGVKNEFESMAASESHFQNDRPGRSRNDTNFRGESCYTQTVKMHVKDEPLTPPEGIDNRWDSCSSGIKKSLSMSDLLTDSMYHIRANGSVSELLDVKNEFESMAASESYFQNDRPGCSRNDTNFRGESCYTQTVKMRVKDEPLTPPEGIDNGWDSCCSGIKKSLSMSDLLTDSMYHSRANGSVSGLLDVKNEFESMAASVSHFQDDRPGPLRNRPSTFCPQEYTGRSTCTMPHSPMLRWKEPFHPVHVMSQQENEAMTKFKIKSNPIPKRPVASPNPFKLTELPKQAIAMEPKPQFKDRPAPKHILEKPQIPLCKIKPKPLKATENIEKTKPLQRHRQGPIGAELFSFAEREEQIKQCKEEKNRKQMKEEQTQVKQFKEQSLPKNARKVMENACKSKSSTTSSENKENCYKFKAHMPAVLNKPPFKPVLKPINLKSELDVLASEKRAAERKKFDKYLKKLREKREMELRNEQKTQIKELRANLVHSAKPFVPSAPFVPKKSDKSLTVPKTPKCVRRC